MSTLIVLRQRLRLHNSYRCFFSRGGFNQYIEPQGAEIPADFHFYPEFLDQGDQHILLAHALRKLDETGSRLAKRRRKGISVYHSATSVLSDLFLPEEYYEFEEGHYDGVIRHFREAHVTSWPSDPALERVLLRLCSLLPSTLPRNDIQTHVLHLASKGEIFPHLDNIHASGSWIAAVSIGGERVLRMEGPRTFEVLLPSGSAYVQKDSVRYSYKHSILHEAIFKGHAVPARQRISVMLRDRLRPDAQHSQP